MSDYAPSPPSPTPAVREIGISDVLDALKRGWTDFRHAPLLALFFGGICAAGGLVMFWLLSVYREPWMIIPIAVGFPLIGPFLAAGTYEVSRRIEAGERLEFGAILSFMFSRSRHEFSWMAFVVLFVFWIWMYQARVLIALFLDMQAFSSVGALASALFTTTDGLTLLLIGTLIGAVLATIMFATTVVSMPLLVERELDLVTAIVTSWKSVLRNPRAMFCWAAIVVGLTVLAMLPVFLGLLVVFPVLGFATWHLYRRIISSLEAQVDS